MRDTSPPPIRRGSPFRAPALALAVGALITAAWTAAPAAAEARPAPAAVRAGARAERGAVEAARRFLCPHGGAPARGGRCRAGRAAFAAADPGRDLSARDWDAGLPAAARRQAPCPEGTAPARPLFWDDAVRCVFR